MLFGASLLPEQAQNRMGDVVLHECSDQCREQYRLALVGHVDELPETSNVSGC